MRVIYCDKCLFQMSDRDGYRKQDPDYEQVVETPDSFRRRDEELSNREESVKKIQEIFERQFDGEIQTKENEILQIESRISQTKAMLDKLRAYLLANYYGCNGKLIRGGGLKNTKRGRSREQRSATSKLSKDLKKREDPSGSRSLDVERNLGAKNSQTEGMNYENEADHKLQHVLGLNGVSGQFGTNDYHSEAVLSNRFYATKKIVVGNISKFIPLEKREKNDQATHKWMVYVRGPPKHPDISSFIKRVWFFLHPSYMPNDIIEVSRAPFTVTRRGWGEFPVRIQLVFNDARNKPVDIIHNLKLDKTYTGLQTLGAETSVELELQRHTVNEASKTHGVSTERTHTREAAEQWEAKKLSASVVRETCKEQFENAKKVHDYDLQLRASKGKSFSTETRSELRDEGKRNDVRELKDFLIDKFDRRGFLKTSAASSNTSTPLTEPCSRVASPLISIGAEKFESIDSQTQQALEKNISRFPLVYEHRERSKLHYCAKTLDQYKSWSYSKRRASEWQRALDVKRFLISSGAVDHISTKEVMMWCRRHGYTPSELETSVIAAQILDFCPRCGKCFPSKARYDASAVTKGWCSGCLSSLNIKQINSLTSFEDLLHNLSCQESRLEMLKEDTGEKIDEEDDTLDVVGLNVESHSAGSQKEVPLIDISKLPSVSPSFATDWIFEAAAQIEVHLPSIDVNGQKVPVLQQLLLTAMKAMIREILTHSYATAKNFESNLGPVLVTPLHIHKALRKIPHLDFLANDCFGIREEDGNI